MPPSPLKLYSNPNSRGAIVEWYLKELGLEYDCLELDFATAQHKELSYLQIHPFGRIPALEDGEMKLFESGAILTYLAQKYAKLSPEELAIAVQWLFFSNSTLSEAIFEDKARETKLPGILSALNAILAKHKYITGDKMTVSDICLASYLLYMPLIFPDFDMTPYPLVDKYARGLAALPTAPGYCKAFALKDEDVEEPQAKIAKTEE